VARVAIDARELKVFASAMRKVSRRAGTETRLALREGGEIIAAEARILAAQHSKRIPDTIKTRVLGASVIIEAGGDAAPNAVPFEVGNAGTGRGLLRSERTGKFRHPVFGNRSVWVDQDTHPSLGPAAVANQDKALEQIASGLNRAFRTAGLELD
jgi:hypothetical protein